MNQDPSSTSASTTPASPPPRKPLGARVWRRAVDYVPLLLALVLALTTFWLVRSMPKIRQPEPELPADVPDYYLHDFQLRRYGAQGNLQDELTGQYGEHLPVPDTIHIQQATMRAANPQGSSTQGRAKRAVAGRQSQDIELFDQVHVVHQPAPAANGQVSPHHLRKRLPQIDRPAGAHQHQPPRYHHAQWQRHHRQRHDLHQQQPHG